MPVPTGTIWPTITFSVIPFSSSICPAMLASNKCLTVTSNPARAKTLSFSPLIPCLPICLISPVYVIKSAINIMCLMSTLRPCSSNTCIASLIIAFLADSIPSVLAISCKLFVVVRL